MPEIGKINIDFQVLKTYDPKTLLIADSSDWKHIVDKTSLVHITMPGGRVARELFWEKQKVNIFNSSILGITPKACDISELRELPDGIYTIKVIGSPDTYFKERNYLRTERLQLDLDKLYMELGVDFDPDKKALRDRLNNINIMIKAAESSMRHGDISKTSSYFREAQKLIKDYIECDECK